MGFDFRTSCKTFKTLKRANMQKILIILHKFFHKEQLINLGKILLTNVLLIALMLILVEAFFYYEYYTATKKHLEEVNLSGVTQKFRYTTPHQYNLKFFKKTFRKKIGTSKKRPLLFIGGSYTKGAFLKREQTLAYKVWQLTDRTTYKRGICGGGIHNILDQLESGVMKKEVPDAEYIIYTYIPAHIDRLYQYDLDYIETFIDIQYVLDDEKLVKLPPPKFPILYSLFTVKYLQNIAKDYFVEREFDKGFPLFMAVMEKSMDYFKIQYPNSKIVVLLYPDGVYTDIKRGSKEDLAMPVLPEDQIEDLEEMGYIVINAEDLTDKPIRTAEYRVEDRDHPNEKAWDIIAPALVKKLNLK